jgi:Zn-dependent protease with chaperone function
LFVRTATLPLSIIMLVLLCQLSLGQKPVTYQPYKDDENLKNSVRADIRKRNVADSLAIAGKHKKQLRSIYRDRFELIDEMFDENEFIFTPAVHEYLQKIVARIYKSNPNLSQAGTQYVFSRSFWPNAASFGNGTVSFNISLITKLDNEAQVAFVLCHEMAHYHLDHGNRHINQVVNNYYSEEMQEKLKAIKKMKYGQGKELGGLAQAFTYKNRRHNREFESQSDSMAMEYMKNTGYDMREAVAALNILDSIDKEYYDPETDLPKVFNFSSYAFQDKWIKKERAFFGGVIDTLNQKEKDSLKTHPDCKLRAASVEKKMQNIQLPQSGSKFLVSESEFASLKERSRYEVIQFCFERNNLSLALYRSLDIFSREPDNVYLATMVGRCFEEIFKRQKNHTVNTVVETPSPYVDKKYNALLNFFQKVRLKDIGAIGYYFMQQHQDKFGSNTEYNSVLQRCKQNFESVSNQ